MEFRQYLDSVSLDNAYIVYTEVPEAWNLRGHVQIHSLHVLQILPCFLAVYHRLWTWILLSHSKPGLNYNAFL